MDERVKIVGFISKQIESAYNELEEGKFEDKELYAFIARARKDLQENPIKAGTRIPERLIPKEYGQKFGIKSLWKYDLPNAWRLLYTITGDEIRIVSIILEWLSHKEYERRFKY